MTKAEALARLRAHEPELRALGIERLSLFGSTARGEERADSDVDLAAFMDYDQVRTLGPFGFFGIEDSIAEMIGVKVDLVTEPTRKSRLQAQIDRDRVHVFRAHAATALRYHRQCGSRRSLHAGSDFAAFLADTRTTDAVERCLSRITEAVIHIGEAEADQLGLGVPWQQVRGMGNKLRHEYRHIDPREILQTARDDLPALRAAAARALSEP